MELSETNKEYRNNSIGVGGRERRGGGAGEKGSCLLNLKLDNIPLWTIISNCPLLLPSYWHLPTSINKKIEIYKLKIYILKRKKLSVCLSVSLSLSLSLSHYPIDRIAHTTAFVTPGWNEN